MANATLTRLVGPLALTAATETVVFTSTSSLGAIIKEIRFSMPATGAPQAVSWGILPVGQSPGTGARWLLESVALNPSDPVTDVVSQVLANGDRIIALATGTGVTVTVSGAVIA